MANKEKVVPILAYPTTLGLFLFGSYLIYANIPEISYLGGCLVFSGILTGFAGLSATHPVNKNK